MIKKTLLLMVCALGTTLAAQAQTFAEDHPIDQEISACKTENPNTLGFVECDMEGSRRWLAEMESVYMELEGLLGENERQLLADQHEAWKNYCSLQLAFNETFYRGRGHEGLLMIASSRTDLYRQRTLSLKIYLDMLMLKK